MPSAAPGQAILGRRGSRRVIGVNSVVFDASALAYFAAMTVQPDDTFKNAVNAFYVGAKADGFYTGMDAFWFYCANSTQSAYLNGKNPATFTTTEAGTGTFTAYRGYQPNGTTGYLNSGFNPTTAGGVYTLNAAAFGAYINGGVDTTVRTVGQTAAASVATLVPRNGSAFASIRVNNATAATTAVALPSRLGWRGANRKDATNISVFVEGVRTDFTQTSSAIPTSNMTFGADPGLPEFSQDRIAFAFVGALSDAQMANLRTRLVTCLTAIGAQ